MKCDGDSAHLCGGPVRLNVYQKAAAPPAPPAPPAPAPPAPPAPAPPATSATQYRIRIMKLDGTRLGYVRQRLADSGFPTLTRDVLQAAAYKLEGPIAADGFFDLRQIDPVVPTYPYFGAYHIMENGQWIDYVKHTPEGSTPQKLGSNFDAGSAVESRIWKKDPTTSQLSQVWVRSDGSSQQVFQVYAAPEGDPEYAGFMAMFDTSEVAQTSLVKFYLEGIHIARAT
ncbi:hypothetical protein M408DRAFT_180648 [Serendipita vermifera MAFF 305830]|uniref:Uncharacterized protein n=1 Tax=Serendipita vermifera MAFF 305830 TaxID=933852 RepID=A0A0C3AI11_SERVB|nr:hypothetical protein M408DRAFT_180648 [Serendipita vermifera MAFF 305830]